MQRAPATIEEQLLLKAIKEECPWESLPKRLQVTLSSKEEWHRRVIEHCIKKRLPWNTCFARKVCKESEYYEDMMRYLRRNLALFPYHLAEYVCRVMRVSPFRYYCDMIFEVMRNEQPYDSIPNFSAADALRLTGIGRNEFIDIMNKCRSKKIMWKLNKSIAKELLPTQPVDFTIEPWWGICLVNFTLEEFKKLSEEETATIDKICKEEANSYILFDPDIIKGLHQRGLVYFDVPVYPDDRFKVSRLEGFVSNREQSYEDPIEELLYAVFVVSSEYATVAELATTLQADLSQLQAAASFACRLGWAVKVFDPASVLQDTSLPGSPRNSLSEEDTSGRSTSSAIMFADGEASLQGDVSGTENSLHDRVAFVVDANITSYLMMGSVSPGLKSHAVTLYEAGKLGHTSITDLCKDLSTLEGTKFEGELQEFANHAFSLRCVLECLQSGGAATDVKTEEVCKNMDMMASNNDAATLIADISDVTLTKKSEHLATHEVDVDDDISVKSGIPQEGSVLAEPVTDRESDEILIGTLSEDITSLTEVPKPDLNLQNNEKPIHAEGLDVGREILKKKKKFRVDILRCESLASLATATLDRLFRRDYDIVVSMIPLPPSSVLPGPAGPINFGPPSYSCMTPWMKLVLYSTVACGPLSVVLMKGQCLRLLPAPLAGCEKALLWSWDGSTIGGLGGKFEGNLVKGSVLLHCLNSLLKYSAVLVQPLSRYDLDESGRIITMDIPLPLKDSDGSVACIGEELELSEKESSKLNSLLCDMANKIELWTVGYIRLLKLYKERDSEHFAPDDEKYEWVPLSVEFGMPLFSPKLCNNICKRVVSSQLLQKDLLTEHHDAMQSLRKRLRDVCAEYQATGSAAKLLYQKEQSKDFSRHLMNYASGRWNPLVDPSSPISGASSEHQRLKLANRHRSRAEVLSFDGSILRSYALAPVYEAATRPVEEAPPVSTTKVEEEEADSREVVLPGVNLVFDGSELHPFEIGACLQARQPVSLIAEAAAASATLQQSRGS
ncbi:protein FAM91A1 isoform X1 [Pyrus x bretschneideri]|uniref:protein FAM91A1 isoform X1 n=2 Tax=Pyrus x bretschneideri TaxID=225117 RepID=UPI00202E6CCD|nr:protein FAM91A1 isoform X1 [Pyrus x bretschneideri]XP_048437338.1 protein FAM91A1 isoform X1 [Pyrus x bretschneideri]XP_048437340.1 protein FAM91A1 isoform X1 [Pyrus x bretschneideri]